MPAVVIQERHTKGCSGVRPVRAGDEDGFEAFFRAVFPKAVAVARRVTGDRAAAEDAAIEAMAKAHLRWRRIGPAPWREAWALRVAVNEAIRRLPRRPPMPAPAREAAARGRATVGARLDGRDDGRDHGRDDGVQDGHWGVGRHPAGRARTLREGADGERAEGTDLAEEVVLRQALAAALRRLPRRQREVVVLRYLVGLSETQVAETLDISYGTVKTHLRRGIAGLRKNMDQDLTEEHLASLT
jgi:RNA polymerase sigma factor (sigma-70 family)